jgi:hypothetical protein
VRDIFGNVFGPALGGIEGDNADRVGILAGEQILDDGFQIGGLVIGLDPGATRFAGIIRHQIHRLIVAVGHDRLRPIEPKHRNKLHELHARTGIQAAGRRNRRNANTA